jgi:DNA-binding MarR family transcriptional regulator
MTLKDELKMSGNFRSQRQEALLSLMRTQAVLEPAFNRVFSFYGLTNAQFNILRILKGNRGSKGMACSDIGSRLISRDSDVTRLVDRLVKSDLAERHRPEEDRRKVLVQITSEGKELIEKLLPLLKVEEERALGHMAQKDLLALIQLLDRVREPHI